MKRYKGFFDVVLLLGLAAITVLAIAPKTIVMPNTLQMSLLAAVLILLAGFMVLMWREDPADERELQNQVIASRSAYLIGSLVLIVGLVIQSLDHAIDPVVPIALLAMIATKLVIQRKKDE